MPILKKLGDMRLNKSGTVGTEPTAKKNKDGSFTNYTELKFGKLGKIDIPRSTTTTYTKKPTPASTYKEQPKPSPVSVQGDSGTWGTQAEMDRQLRAGKQKPDYTKELAKVKSVVNPLSQFKDKTLWRKSSDGYMKKK